MTGTVTFRVMLGRGKHGALIAAIIAVALILGLSAHCKKTPIPNAETSEFASADNELSARIKQLVRGLEYPDEVAEDFTRMALDWKDELGRPLLIGWKENLAKAHQDYQEGKMSRNRVAKIEERVVQELCERITRQFGPKELAFELSDVIENRQVDCIGCSQLTYIIGNAVGLSVRPIEVLDLAISLEGDAQAGHMACITDLSDGRSVMADVSFFETRSRAFDLEDHFVKVGNYWELRYKSNRLLLHRRIRLLDRKGLIAAICNSRGHVYRSKGEHGQAILEYSKAIEIDPGFARAYNNRGNRFGDKGEYDRAILDYTKAIEIDPRLAMAYGNRANTYYEKGEYDGAISDYGKVIEINPEFAVTYLNRGEVYAKSGKSEEAKKDLLKALELDPELKESAKKASEQHKLDLKLD